MPGGEGEVARDAVAALVEVYGEALARLLTVIGPGSDLARRLAHDPLVGHLLILHGLHPEPTASRVAQAVAEFQGHLQGGQAVELAGIEDGIARISVTASGCGSQGISESVRDMVLGAAPELDGVEATSQVSTSTFIPLEALHRQSRR